MATAPGDLGLARAYVSGDLEPYGVHPGDPYELLKALADKMDFKRPPARVLANIVRSIGIEHLKPIAPPPQEALPDEAALIRRITSWATLMPIGRIEVEGGASTCCAVATGHPATRAPRIAASR